MLKLIRSSKNPIVMPTNFSWENKAVFNPGAFEFGGKIHLIYRAQGDDEISRFGLLRLSDPENIAERMREPLLVPEPDSEYETNGVEDPRIVEIDKTYYIIYVAASKYPRDFVKDDAEEYSDEWRVRVSLAHTHDFTTITRHGVIVSHIDSKDASLFPEKMNGQFVLIHRIIPAIRLAVSENFEHYKERGTLFGPRKWTWESDKIGIGAPPIKSPLGWILFYHAVDDKQIYRLGLAVLDLKDPTKVIARYPDPILEPEEGYERNGRVKNVVFTCGAFETGEKYLVYYGAADTVIGLASINKQEVFDWISKNNSSDPALRGEIALKQSV